MPNSPGHHFGSCHQCTGFGGEHLAITGATFCTRSQESGQRVCKRPERGCVAWAPAAGRKVIAPVPVDRRWPARNYDFMDPDRANWSRR
jgi:hypothetical protein